uniref:FYVE_2 domain-containing protein n=2 Tax=Macrostomum lignano TaxID=282301 RepID=A0A1I8I1I6_9PLAT
MDSPQCNCDKLSRKTSYYYNEPISEYLCEYCLNQPIVTVWKLSPHELRPELPAKHLTQSALASSATASSVQNRRQKSKNNAAEGSGESTSSVRLSKSAETDTVSSSNWSPKMKSPKPAPRLSLTQTVSRQKPQTPPDAELQIGNIERLSIRLPTPSRRADKTFDNLPDTPIPAPRSAIEKQEFLEQKLKHSLSDRESNNTMDGSNSMHRSALPQWTGVQTDTDSSINSVMSSADDSLRVFSPENVSTKQQPRNRRQQMDEEQYQLYEYP